MPAADGHQPPTPSPFGPKSIRLVLLAIMLGLGYFFLIEATRGYLVRYRLPEPLMNYWLAHPLLGAWLIGALQALFSYWLMGASVGLALALIARRDFVFYGAVATGAALVIAAQLRVDGWYALAYIGPQFFLAHQLNSIAYDPVGAASALFAVPVCTWAWGKLLL